MQNENNNKPNKKLEELGSQVSETSKIKIKKGYLLINRNIYTSGKS